MKFFRKFGPHYAIERFGILFLSLALSMIVLIASIVARKIQFDNQSLSGMAVYTNEFTFSRTGTIGSVRGVYVNEDHTKCMLLLRFDSMANIPVEASEYRLFLTGSDAQQRQQAIESQPDSMLYMFGSTGYMGVYLQSAMPFPSQILSLTIRSLNSFGDTAGQLDESQYEDPTFARYNQARVYFNPGGSYATTVSFLDDPEWTVTDAYEEMVVRSYEASLRGVLKDDLIQMRDQQLLMTEYTQRLEQLGIAAPDVPEELDGDEIYAINPDDASQKHLEWNNQENRWADMEEMIIYPDDMVSLYLDTNYVVPGGYSFGWQDGSIREGYLEDLTGSDKLTDWMAYFTEQSDKQTGQGLNLDGLTWYYTDGRVFSSGSEEAGDEVNTGGQTATIQENITALTSAWTTYFDLKQKYQTEDLYNLLQLECDVQNVSSSYSVNTGEDTEVPLLTLY